MQMGDCNAPSTFQQLMTTVFQEFLGRFVHVYLDDIFEFGPLASILVWEDHWNIPCKHRLSWARAMLIESPKDGISLGTLAWT